MDLAVEAGPSSTSLNLSSPVLRRGIHILALARTRPLSQSADGIGMTSNVSG
jgi:hypothetical protein